MYPYHPGMVPALRALLGVAFVSTLPGLAVLRALRVRTGAVLAIAVVPALSLGVTYLVTEVSRLTGMPFSPFTWGVAVALLIVAAIARERRARSRTGRSERTDRWQIPRPDVMQCMAVALLVVAVGLGLATWARALHGRSLVPPNWDATYHGYFTRRIADQQTVRAKSVLVATPLSHKPIENFYPLGMHALAATAHRVSGGTVSDVLTLLLVLSAAVILPAGMFALARRVVPDAPLVAGFAALAAPMLELFPYKPTAWGGIPLVVASCLVPGGAALVYDAIVKRWSLFAGVGAALALVGIFMSHTSEVPMVLVLVALLVGEEVLRTRGVAIVVPAAARLAVIGVVSILLLATILPQFRGGVTERSALGGYHTDPLEFALGNILVLHAWLADRHVAYAVLSLIGIGVALYTRRAVIWTVGFGGMLALYLLEMTSQGRLARALGLPWYHSAERVAYNFAYFLPLFIGILLWVVTRALHGRRQGLRMAVAGSVVALVALATVGLSTYHSNASNVRGFFDSSLIGPDQRAAFRYLGRHSRTSWTVLTDGNNDGSLWMYAVGGATPVFLLPPPIEQIDAEWGKPEFVRKHVADIGRDPAVDRAVRELRIHYVYFDSHAADGTVRSLSNDLISASPAARLVFRRGTASVYRLVSP